MPEIRTHPLTGEKILLAPERSHRPNAFANRITAAQISPADCPFCPGHEEETPPEIIRYGSGGEWLVRVVPNKYPVVSPDLAGEIHGRHEVLIESRLHGVPFHALSSDEGVAAAEACIERFSALEASGLRYVTIFKNEGILSGQSIDHAHSQVVALSEIPERALREAAAHSPCVLCAMASGGKNVIFENERFVATAPWASRFPYELWVVPKEHAPAFVELDRTGIQLFASSLQLASKAIEARWPGASINWAIRNHTRAEQTDGRGHWRVEVMPRLQNLAGFELTSGLWINVVDPEKAATELREAIERSA